MSETFPQLEELADQLMEQFDVLNEKYELERERFEETLEEKDEYLEELEDERMDRDDELFMVRQEQTDLIRAQGLFEELFSRYDELRKTEEKELDDVEELIKLANMILRMAREFKQQLQDMWDLYRTGLERPEEEEEEAAA